MSNAHKDVHIYHIADPVLSRIEGRCRLFLQYGVASYALVYAAPWIYASSSRGVALAAALIFTGYFAIIRYAFPFIWKCCTRTQFVEVRPGELWLEGRKRIVLAEVSAATIGINHAGEETLHMEMRDGSKVFIAETVDMDSLVTHISRNIPAKIQRLDRIVRLLPLSHRIGLSVLVAILAIVAILQYFYAL